MNQIDKIESLTQNLPDAEGARRFFSQMAERNPSDARKLLKNEGLLSDVLTIAAFSPLLAATLLQNTAYISWLSRHREQTKIRSKEELLESLARFALTNSEIEAQILLARFRRRELLSVYLRDIRRLKTISETTEEISHLADAILEYALRIAKQELDNRYGIPLGIDEKGRTKPADFCIVSLGKLGSKELNYSSDIDLLFLYSTDGTTSGQGVRGAVSNREYFVKLSEFVTKIVGRQTGEGAAYRVDLRLRPHGRVGALAVSLPEAVKYYQNSAQAWERQTLIRARISAGDNELFKDFFSQLETSIYPINETVENALRNVRLSKEKINLEKATDKGFDVKLGTGGIREIEFIAQALQIAYGGKDVWLRSPHTLISLARLADRNLINQTELTELYDAYDFLRRLEHRLQMEQGLQTHLVPEENERRQLVARRMNCKDSKDFDSALHAHTSNVNRIFERVFGEQETDFSIDNNSFYRHEIQPSQANSSDPFLTSTSEGMNSGQLIQNILVSLQKSETDVFLDSERKFVLKRLCETSAYFGEILAANPALISALPIEKEDFQHKDYTGLLSLEVSKHENFREALAVLRHTWTKLFLEIGAFDVAGKIDLSETKRLQTDLAEASLKTALQISQKEISRLYKLENNFPFEDFRLPFAVLGLGKLGGRGMDYGSDLDLVLIYDEHLSSPSGITASEFYCRFAEILVTTLSSFTREGHLYRIDLRLRPDGRNGATALSKTAFLNYLENRSAIWEWLAYVKLRGISGDLDMALITENLSREIVHQKASKADLNELRTETWRVRARLEQEKTRGSKAVNIKYGAGGLLDIYFAMRFLQLRDNVPDDEKNRSTQFMLERLFETSSLNEEDFYAFSEGHRFLNLLDHNLRLTVGRSNQLPLANKTALRIITERMNLSSISDLTEKLSLHRMEIRSAFERILGAG